MTITKFLLENLTHLILIITNLYKALSVESSCCYWELVMLLHVTLADSWVSSEISDVASVAYLHYYHRCTWQRIHSLHITTNLYKALSVQSQCCYWELMLLHLTPARFLRFLLHFWCCQPISIPTVGRISQLFFLCQYTSIRSILMHITVMNRFAAYQSFLMYHRDKYSCCAIGHWSDAEPS